MITGTWGRQIRLNRPRIDAWRARVAGRLASGLIRWIWASTFVTVTACHSRARICRSKVHRNQTSSPTKTISNHWFPTRISIRSTTSLRRSTQRAIIFSRSLAKTWRKKRDCWHRRWGIHPKIWGRVCLNYRVNLIRRVMLWARTLLITSWRKRTVIVRMWIMLPMCDPAAQRMRFIVSIKRERHRNHRSIRAEQLCVCLGSPRARSSPTSKPPWISRITHTTATRSGTQYRLFQLNAT